MSSANSEMMDFWTDLENIDASLFMTGMEMEEFFSQLENQLPEIGPLNKTTSPFEPVKMEKAVISEKSRLLAQADQEKMDLSYLHTMGNQHAPEEMKFQATTPKKPEIYSDPALPNSPIVKPESGVKKGFDIIPLFLNCSSGKLFAGPPGTVWIGYAKNLGNLTPQKDEAKVKIPIDAHDIPNPTEFNGAQEPPVPEVDLSIIDDDEEKMEASKTSTTSEDLEVQKNQVQENKLVKQTKPLITRELVVKILRMPMKTQKTKLPNPTEKVTPIPKKLPTVEVTSGPVNLPRRILSSRTIKKPAKYGDFVSTDVIKYMRKRL